jgi:predicted GNAT superfamily acetyltransferase
VRLRAVADSDVPTVLALNEPVSAMTSVLSAERLRQLLGWAAYPRVVERDGRPVAFVLTFAAGSAYDSKYFGWFADRYDSFLYLDRIVVAEDHRRQGVGRFVYDAMEELATPLGRLVCEVNLEPRNDASIAFHEGRGYVEVGQLADGTGRVSSMLAKDLG